MREVYEGLGGFDSPSEFSGVGGVETLVAAHTHQRYEAVVEAFFYFLALVGIKAWFDAVFMRGSQLDAEQFGPLAVSNQRRQVPIFTPEVGN